MRWVLAVLAWVISVLVLAPVCFFVVMALAGPHSSMLPSYLQPVVLVLGWAALLVLPVVMARAAWRRLTPRAHDEHLPARTPRRPGR